MTSTEEYGPDNPRDWNPNAAVLKSQYAPHETGGVLRAFRAGHKGADLMSLLKIKTAKMQRELQKALSDETRAVDSRREIHDALIDKSRT